MFLPLSPVKLINNFNQAAFWSSHFTADGAAADLDVDSVQLSDRQTVN